MAEPTVTEAAFNETFEPAKPQGKPERTRTSDSRIQGGRAPGGAQGGPIPAAGAHAAGHLVNEDATPGAGALPSHAHGREVDGAAG